MPPLLRPSRALCPNSCSSTLTSFLLPLPAPATQQRSASILNALSDVPSSYNKRIRVGRGPSSGKGKTAGRGQKGQHAHGKVPRNMIGGQTPMHITHPEKGFKNLFALDYAVINIEKIQHWIDTGRIDPKKPITVYEIYKSGLSSRIKDGVKLLARGKEVMRTPVNMVVSRASAEAIAAIEAVGGNVTTRFYSAESINRIIHKQTHPYHSIQWRGFSHSLPSLSQPARVRRQTASENEAKAQAAAEAERLAAAESQDIPEGYIHRLPDATGRKDIEYYRDPARRGYLSYTVKANEGPSLFFRTAKENARLQARLKKPGRKTGDGKAVAENRLW